MSILIIACGNTGVTLKAAQSMAKMIGDAEAVDAKSKKDIGGYDAYIVGTNIHFGKFNKRFYKTIKEIEKFNDAEIYIYICGAEVEKKDHYINLMHNVVPKAKDIRFVWGELNTDGVSFFKRYAIESFITGRKKDGLPKPRLLEKELRALSENFKDMG